MNCDCTEKISSLIDGELAPAGSRARTPFAGCVDAVARAFLNLRGRFLLSGFQLVGQKLYHAFSVNRELLEVVLAGDGFSVKQPLQLRLF